MIPSGIPSNEYGYARWSWALSELRRHIVERGRESLLEDLNKAYRLNSSSSRYPGLKEEFISLFGQDVQIILKDGSYERGILLSCPVCGEMMSTVHIIRAGEDPSYQNLLSELMLHLMEDHLFNYLIEVVRRGDRGIRTTYKCKICGATIRGVIEAVNHVCQHALEE